MYNLNFVPSGHLLLTLIFTVTETLTRVAQTFTCRFINGRISRVKVCFNNYLIVTVLLSQPTVFSSSHDKLCNQSTIWTCQIL